MPGFLLLRSIYSSISGPMSIIFTPIGFLANVGVLQAVPYYKATTDFVAN